MTRGSALLRKWRDREKLTQPQAAERLGLNLVQVSKLERGATPGLRNALKIAKGTSGAVPVEAWAEMARKAS